MKNADNLLSDFQQGPYMQPKDNPPAGKNQMGRALQRIDYIVLHGTVRSTAAGAFDAMRNAGTSAHFVIDKDGTGWKMVPVTNVAFHAGRSGWKDDNLLNKNSIGIEIVNWVVRQKDGSYDPFPKEQVAAVCETIEALLSQCKEAGKKTPQLLTHSDIAPGRKWDPGPGLLVPLREALLGRGHDDTVWAVKAGEADIRAAEVFAEMSEAPHSPEQVASWLRDVGFPVPVTGEGLPENPDIFHGALWSFESYFSQPALWPEDLKQKHASYEKTKPRNFSQAIQSVMISAPDMGPDKMFYKNDEGTYQRRLQNYKAQLPDFLSRVSPWTFARLKCAAEAATSEPDQKQ
jgi:hypothetical protein